MQRGQRDWSRRRSGDSKKLKTDRRRRFLVRVATWYGLEADEVEEYFSPYALAELEVAENIAPWGEAAANLRMDYLAAIIIAAGQGHTKESREAAGRRADVLRLALFGPQPAKPPPRVSDIDRNRKE